PQGRAADDVDPVLGRRLALAADDNQRTDLGRSLRVPERDHMSRGCRRSAKARSHCAGHCHAGRPAMIDLFMLICLLLPLLMLALAITYDARRRSRNKRRRA